MMPHGGCDLRVGCVRLRKNLMMGRWHGGNVGPMLGRMGQQIFSSEQVVFTGALPIISALTFRPYAPP